jgi:hypothetical protein
VSKDGLDLTAEVKQADFAAKALDVDVQGTGTNVPGVSPNRVQQKFARQTLAGVFPQDT